MPSSTKTKRHFRDQYQTPYGVINGLIKQLVSTCVVFDTVIDLGCGPDGRIGNAILAANIATRGEFIDIDPDFSPTINTLSKYVCIDAIKHLNNKVSSGSEIVVMNPPFSLAFEFLQAATEYTINNPRLTLIKMLMPLSFLGSKKRKLWFINNPPNSLSIIDPRPSFTNDNKTDSSVYCWGTWSNFNILKGFTQLSWLDCPKREDNGA